MTLTTHDVPTADLTEYHANPRRGNVDRIADSLQANGQYRAIVVNKGTRTGRPMEVLAGNHTLKAARKLGWTTIAAHIIDVDDQDATRIVLADNQTSDLATNDDKVILQLLDTLDTLDGTGYTTEDLDTLIADIENAGGEEPTAAEPITHDSRGSLADRFGVPPLTVLDSRSGTWKTRKDAWKTLIADSTEGRDNNLTFQSPSAKYQDWYDVKNAAERRVGHTVSDDELLAAPEAEHLTKFAGLDGTSAFDPVLSELLTLWYSAPNDTIIDPWAGGVVRGAVAAIHHRHYHGIDISPTQVDTNRAQWQDITSTHQATTTPTWTVGDSRTALRAIPSDSADLMLACPPYYGLEKYSDDPGDMSNMSPSDFDTAMTEIMVETHRILRPHRFAAITVAEVRHRGHITSLVNTIVTAAHAAGFHYLQDMILLKQVGTAAVRTANAFTRRRTVARTHENIVILVKGDAGEATRRLSTDDITTATQALASITSEAEGAA